MVPASVQSAMEDQTVNICAKVVKYVNMVYINDFNKNKFFLAVAAFCDQK